jgi:hypothetical protein
MKKLYRYLRWYFTSGPRRLQAAKLRRNGNVLGALAMLFDPDELGYFLYCSCYLTTETAQRLYCFVCRKKCVRKS